MAIAAIVLLLISLGVIGTSTYVMYKSTTESKEVQDIPTLKQETKITPKNTGPAI